MYDHILFPTDGSDAAQAATAHAYTLADDYDATLHVLHVVNAAELASMVAPATSYHDELKDRGHDIVEDIVTEAEGQGLAASGTVRVGTPHTEIVEYADTNDIDLIAMGTHGRSGVDRLVVGSVTERVIRLSDTPVMAVQTTD